MLQRFFSPKSTQPKDMKDITRTELLALTNRHFHALFPTCEVENLVVASHVLLQNLPIENPDFDKHYDAIIFGTLVVAMAIEKWKYGFAYPSYPKTLMELMDLCAIKKIALIGNIENDPNIKNLIVSVGNKVLEKSLPFNENYLDSFSLSLQHHVPLKQRLEKYIPKVVYDNSEKINPARRFSCNIA